ncbi:MAG: AAA family ATPase [Planctomycetaceae bacterium]
MKITELDIDRFRIWRSLLLKLNPGGLNVIYGPNEAGKTTLMQFVRSVLYGFQPLSQEPAWHRPEDDVPWKGSIRCEHEGRTWRLTRKAHDVTRGSFRISGGPNELSKNDSLSHLLADTSESVFTDIFAVGVRELQQLSTLGSEQVAEYIYGLSLGPQGRQLLDALASLKQRHAALYSHEGKQGRVPELFERYAQLSVSRRKTGEDREKHARLTRRRQELEASISELQAREGSINNELRGLRFINNCYKPWKQIRDLQEQLNQIPLIHHSPDAALDQLEACERDIQTHSARREKLAEQAEQFQKQADRLVLDEKFEKDRYAVQSLVDQAEWLRQLDEQIRQAQDRASDMKRTLDHRLSEMGEGWDLRRLNAIDTSSASHHQLLQHARRYQDAMQRRAKLRRWNRGLSKRSQQELVELNNDLEALGIESIPDAIQREQKRMTELDNLGRLRLQREQLGLKIKTVRSVISRVDTDDGIPYWVDRAVTSIAIVAFALFSFGLLTFGMGAEANRSLGGALAAASFAFAGMMWWGIRNGLRNHFDRKTGIQLDDLNDESRKAERELRAIQERIQNIRSSGLAGQHLLKADAPGASAAELVECIGECSRHITELEKLSRRHERAMARRRRLKTLRERFGSAQQAVNERRQQWCRLLNSLGMDETVKVQEAFDWWQRIQELRELQTQWRNVAPEVEGLRRMFDGMQKRIEQVGQRLSPTSKLSYARPLEVLTAWGQQLKTHERDRLEKQRLTSEGSEKSREATTALHEVEAAELRRGAVLARSGVLTREELLKQKEWQQRRRDLEQKLTSSREELNEVAFAEPEMAIVEDDLIRFDPPRGREQILMLEMELEEVEQKLNSNHEGLGSLKHEIKQLEAGRGSQAQYFQKAQVATDIYRAAEEWFALQIERDVVNRMRSHFEKENISGTLRTASAYLHRISSGRYHRIWAPLGEDFLCVDDEYDRTFRVEQLSGGTREQLFLALRFALAREFNRRGIELPMVMDDLFVNFDEERTEAAVECLIELADDGQQVLFFTCHQHLAELFQKKNVEPLWLPGHKVAVDIHKPEDEGAAFPRESGQHARVDTPETELAESKTIRSRRQGLVHASADELFDEDSAVAS